MRGNLGYPSFCDVGMHIFSNCDVCLTVCSVKLKFEFSSVPLPA